MFFPDPRTRVAVPLVTEAQAAALRKRLYRPAFVENVHRDELSLSFLRPPGWEVGPPSLIPTTDFPVPFLCGMRRKAPDAALEVAFYEATHDVLPGDFLDAVFDGLTMSHASEGPLHHGWYADRSVDRPHGAELLAAHRFGKDLLVVIGAAKREQLAKSRDEMLHIIGTLGPKAVSLHPYAGRWRMHDDDAQKLAYAVPDDVKATKQAGGTTLTWDIEGGPVTITVRPIPPQKRRLEDVEQALLSEVRGKGAILDEHGRGGDLEAAPGGVFTGPVIVRAYETTSASKRAAEVTLLVGTRADGTRVRLTLDVPARTAHKIAWMRGRFAFVQLVTTLARSG